MDEQIRAGLPAAGGAVSEREPAPLWLALLLVFTVPLWVPVAPLVGWWRARVPRRREPGRREPDTLPFLEFFAGPATS